MTLLREITGCVLGADSRDDGLEIAGRVVGASETAGPGTAGSVAGADKVELAVEGRVVAAADSGSGGGSEIELVGFAVG